MCIVIGGCNKWERVAVFAGRWNVYLSDRVGVCGPQQSGTGERRRRAEDGGWRGGTNLLLKGTECNFLPFLYPKAQM